MKQISSGVIIINDNDEILGCIPSGRQNMKFNFCDIPKGGIEYGESPIEAAIRETYEETGIDLSSTELIDLGHHYYLKNKDLYLFKCNLNVDIKTLKCTSFFDFNGKKILEVADFIWVNKNDIKNKFYNSLYPLIIKNL